MRFSLMAIALSCCAGAAAAETFSLNSQVTEATLYPGLAEVSRVASVNLPAGQHRLLLQDVPLSADLETLQVEIAGARRIATLLREDYVPPRDAQDPAVAAAEARIRDVEARIAEVQDAASRAQAGVRAAEVSIGFLQQLGMNEGLAQGDAAALSAVAQMIAAEAAGASRAAVDAAAEAREIGLQLEALEEELAMAEAALAALRPEDEARLFLAVDVTAEQAGEAEVTLRYFTSRQGGIGWQPAYEMHLDSTADTPAVTVKRAVVLRQDTGENWQDVALTLSTALPFGQGAPSTLYPQLRRIEEPRPVAASLSKRMMGDVAELAAAPEPIIEPVVVAEDAQWGADLDGVAATYRFGQRISVASGADLLRLEMDSLNTAAELTAVAVPQRDEVAYRVATFTNSFGEQLLAAEGVPYFVDGKLIAVADFAGLAPGVEMKASFGPINGLRIRRDVLDQSEGEQGLISRSNEQAQRVEIEVENLTDQDWMLRLLDRVPYSQQEDLEVSWRAEPRPSVENVEKQRGILAWDMELGAGEARSIQLYTTLSWPEGMVLR